MVMSRWLESEISRSDPGQCGKCSRRLPCTVCGRFCILMMHSGTPAAVAAVRPPMRQETLETQRIEL
jgi:hypothetical protein